jgi:hypothetical protein
VPLQLGQSLSRNNNRSQQFFAHRQVLFPQQKPERTHRRRPGVDLPDLEAARDQAMKAAREIIAEQLLNDQTFPGETIEIADNRGNVLAYIPLKAAIEMAE